MKILRLALPRPVVIIALGLFALLYIDGKISNAAVITQLTFPRELGIGTTTINFEGYAENTVANNLYLDEGVRFTRDDGGPIPIADWAALGRITTSPPNVIATISLMSFTYVDHLNLIFTAPQSEVGAFFGNDQSSDFASVTLSVFDRLNTFLGSVNVQPNNNTSVDQFIGLRSDFPFITARFQNNEPFVNYSVVLDDVVFNSVIPEPSAIMLLSLATVTLAGFRWICRGR
jgi:hypothetical protein